ncbi:T9SS type A sorting domain-containing protein [bacterium]|nr:T9SS type A sorting domain-containing protein [bacterium]
MWLALMIAAVVSTAASQPLDTMWQRTFGSGDCTTWGFVGLDSTGCLIGGDLTNHDNWEDADILIYRVDPAGNWRWSYHYGEREYYEEMYDVWRMPEGGFLVYALWSELEPGNGYRFLIRLTDEGDTLWTRSIEFQLPDSVSIAKVELTRDGRLLLGGCSRRTHWGNCDMFYALADLNGDTLWTGQYTDGETDDDMIATAVAETPDGYAFATDVAIGFGREYCLLLVDSLGEVRSFRQCLYAPLDNHLLGMTALGVNGFLLFGWRYQEIDPGINGLILYTDSNGDSLWLVELNGDLFTDQISHAIETQDGGVLAVGERDWDHDGAWWGIDVLAVKLDSTGVLEWEATYGTVNKDERAEYVYQRPDGGYLIAGTKHMTNGFNYLVISTWPEGWEAAAETELYPVEFTLKQNYPNPFNGETRIDFSLEATAPAKLSVFDVLGREVKTLADGKLAAGNYSYYLHGDDLPSGVYLYRLQAGNTVAVKKMVLLR